MAMTRNYLYKETLMAYLFSVLIKHLDNFNTIVVKASSKANAERIAEIIFERRGYFDAVVISSSLIRKDNIDDMDNQYLK
jgi:hypothetical protein